MDSSQPGMLVRKLEYFMLYDLIYIKKMQFVLKNIAWSAELTFN